MSKGHSNLPGGTDASDRTPSPLTPTKRVLLRLLLVGASGLLVLLLGEVATRAYAAFERYRAYAHAEFAEDIWATYDPILGYRLNPSFGDHNEAGMRDRPLPAPSDKFRVLILGDSIGYYGDSVDDTYVRHLENVLRQGEVEAPIEVINASVKGYTTHQEVLFLESDGPALRPDLVGIAFVLNDVHPFLHSFHQRDGRIIRSQLYHFTEAASADRPAWLGSHFLRWLSYRLELSGNVARYMVAGGFPFEYRADISSAWDEQRWAVVRAALERFRQLAEERGFRPFIVAFPMRFQYDEALLIRDRDRLLAPQATLARLADELEIPFLDLHPVLSAEHFNEDDGLHLTRSGRLEVARPIAEFLREQRLIPAP